MSNEAAERLREGIEGANFHPSWREGWHRDLDAALAAERKATVERIRAAATQVDIASHGELSMHDLDAILDAEAARET